MLCHLFLSSLIYKKYEFFSNKNSFCHLYWNFLWWFVSLIFHSDLNIYLLQRGRVKCEQELCPKLNCSNQTTVIGSCCPICPNQIGEYISNSNSQLNSCQNALNKNKALFSKTIFFAKSLRQSPKMCRKINAIQNPLFYLSD